MLIARDRGHDPGRSRSSASGSCSTSSSPSASPASASAATSAGSSAARSRALIVVAGERRARRPHGRRRARRDRRAGDRRLRGVDRRRQLDAGAVATAGVRLAQAETPAAAQAGRAPAPSASRSRRGTAVGVEQVAEQLDPVGEPRPGPRERSRRRRPRRRVRPRARCSRSRCAACLGQRLLAVQAAGHDDDDVGPGRRDLLPGRRRASARPGSARASVPPAASIISGTQWPAGVDGVEPLERGDPGPLERRRRGPHGVDPRLQRAPQARPAVGGAAGRPPSRSASASTSPSVEGSSESTRGRLGSRAGDGDDVVVGDRADRADGLGDDQIDVELGQPLLVELVERLAALGALAYGGVDRGRRRGPRGSRCGSGWQLAGGGRPVALVGDGDDLGAEPEREAASRSPRGRGLRSASPGHYRIGRMAACSTTARSTERLTGLDGWEREGDAITRSFDRGDFVGSVEFVKRDRRAGRGDGPPPRPRDLLGDGQGDDLAPTPRAA